MRTAALIPFTLVLAAPLPAQQSTQAPPASVPTIVTSGHGETRVTPDRAYINVAVETRGPSAAAAASENARLTQAVLARLRTLGLPDAQLGTWGYTVHPEYDYRSGEGRPRIIGYVARNTVRADVHQISQVGQVIDASLAAGANNIGALDFYSSNVDAARARALTQAVQKARADAEVMASAAGGRLGELLLLSSSTQEPQPPMPYMARDMEMAAQAAPTPINPGEQTLTVTVSARWRFIQ